MTWGVSRRQTVSILGILLAAAAVGVAWLARPVIDWPDRRPVGSLFLADYTHASASNPRGWFNNPSLNIVGPGGPERFREALLEYADRSIAILRRTDSQGMIAWDLEGEEFPQKTSYIGDPRLLDRLAPEMAGVVDEFFSRFRSAGFRYGMTVRPQQIVFDASGRPTQTPASDYDRILLEKIDYARARWGATLFYIDSNGGIRSPGEVFRFRRLALLRPDVLLIPEHHYPLYSSFSAPYVRLRDGDSPGAGLLQLLYPRMFWALNVADAGSRLADLPDLQKRGDILLFPAWFCGKECRELESLRDGGVPN